MGKYDIIIATITRNRPKMLANLYRSLAKIDIPANAGIKFLVVENNDVSTSDGWLHDISEEVKPHPVQYFLETDIGISYARNRALDYGEQEGADFLVFVDDDELVEPDWLTKLLDEQQRMNLDIVGSPVLPTPLEPKLTLWQRFIWSGVERHSARAESRARKHWEQNRADVIKIATGSWMGRLDFFRKTGLRFDPQLGLTGGEDWNLWRQARKLGAATGWAPDAIVYETVPCSRISLSYHFRRNRDHNTTEFALRYDENSTLALRQVPSKILSRFWKLLVALCSLPFKGGPALVSAAMAFGAIVGLLQGCCGKRRLHYEQTTGS